MAKNHHGKNFSGKAKQMSVNTTDAPASRNQAFWEKLDHFNQLPAKERGDVIERLGLTVESKELAGILTKSHFVIPGKTRFECQMCGECCRYARKVANFSYEPCPYLSDQNKCTKHDSHYLVCRWFPFYVHHDPTYGDLLTIKPYCTGYGKGPLVDYDSRVREINGLSSMKKSEEDGAFVIHEVLYLPDRGEWTFPSKTNLDHLLKFLSTKQTAPSQGMSYRSAELEHAQHYTSGLLGSIKEPQLTITEDGRITDLNEAMENICHMGRDKLQGCKLDSVLVNPAGLAQFIKTVFAHGKVAGSPHRLSLASGEIIPVLINAMTYRDRTDGLVHSALLSLQPVSNSVLNDILQSQSYARSLLEASLDALVFLDLDGTILDVNQATIIITGVGREELIGSNFADYFTEPEMAKAGIKETLEKGLVRNFDLLLVDNGKRKIPVQFNATAYHDSEGVLKGIFAAARDVREIKQMIADLQSAKDYSRGLIESGLDLMVTVDRDQRIMDVNIAATQLTGKTREELIGASFLDQFDDPERARRGVNACFAQGAVRNYELNVIKGTETIPVSFNASIYKDSAGDVKGIFGIARDIRERKMMIKEIEDARNYARGLIESSPDMMLTINSNGLITDVNEETAREMEQSREKLLGSRFSLHFNDAIRAEEGVKQAFTQGRVRDYRLDLIKKGGSEPVSFNASIYMGSDGESPLVFAIARKV